MKFTMNRKELADAASQAALIAPARHSVKELRCALLESDPVQGRMSVTATNHEVTLKRHVRILGQTEDECGIAVNASLFAAMLAALDGETVSMTVEENSRLLLESGSASYHIPVLPGKDYPRMEIPFPDDTVPVSAVPSMVHRTVFAVSEENGTMPLLKCVHLRFTKDGLRAVGSDGTCIVSTLGDRQSTGDISFLVPAVSLEKLAKLCDNNDTFSVGTTGRTITFFKEDFAFSARLMQGRYVDTDRMIGSLKTAFTALLDAADLRRAAASVITMASDNKIVFRFQGDTLALICGGSGGTASVSLGIIPLTGDPRGDYCYLASRLERSLRVLNGSLTLGVAQQGMLTLSTEDAFYMQSASRLKECGRPDADKAA